MVVDNKQTTNNNLANLEASLAPAEAEFGAVAKADQKKNNVSLWRQNLFAPSSYKQKTYIIHCLHVLVLMHSILY